MNKLYVRVIFLALCLAAVVSAKIYVDRFASQIPVGADDPSDMTAPIAEYPAEYTDEQPEAAYAGEDDDTLPVDSLSVEGNTGGGTEVSLGAPADAAGAVAESADGSYPTDPAAAAGAAAEKELQADLAVPADDAAVAEGAAPEAAPAAAPTEAAGVSKPGPRMAKP